MADHCQFFAFTFLVTTEVIAPHIVVTPGDVNCASVEAQLLPPDAGAMHRAALTHNAATQVVIAFRC